ncbi:MAG: glycerophosphodiester phosphodiesterase family protein [Clostridia bacterium]
MRVEKNHWLRTTHIAHRGLWGGDVPENTLAAYKAAADAGFAIEIDVHLTADGQVVSHHDANTLRMTGVDKKICETTLDELRKLRIANTDESIPTLKEILPIVKGKSPLLIEIKSESTKVGALEQALYDIIKDYDGDYAIQSFNPYSVRWYTDNAPSIIRGQLSSFFEGDHRPKFQSFVLKRLLFNRSTKVDFVSYQQKNLPNKYVTKAKRQGKLIIGWTVTSQKRQDELKELTDNVIFENYLPTVKF